MGVTSEAASAGSNFRRAAGASFFWACLATVPAQAARKLGANTPSPRAAKASRRLIGGGALEVLTTSKDTGRTTPAPSRQLAAGGALERISPLQPAPEQDGFGLQCDTKHVADSVT